VLLSADRISFAYRTGSESRRVIDAVSLDIEPGNVVGVLGPNGSGKTTLLSLLAGTLRPSNGVVRLGGRELGTRSRGEIARELAVVPQETHAAFDYTVLEMVLMGRYPHLGAFEIEGPRDLAIAQDAMRATGIEALDTRPFDTLSGGEKQRVVIAAALAQSPRVLLLDEPTASLDLAYQLEIAALVTGLNRDRGVTIVLSTHDLNFAASVCRSLVLLRDGRVAAAGPLEEVLTPANIEAVYGVEAEVAENARAGHLTVVPVGPAGRRP
jgi:iron complex transport system ATP-binding protein